MDSYKGNKDLDILNRLIEIDRRKYYEGFKFGKEKRMFQEELKDLEKVYSHALMALKTQIDDCLPQLLYRMEEFLDLHKKNEDIREKLEALLEKTGGETPKESIGNSYE